MIRQRYTDSTKFYDITPTGHNDNVKDGQKLNKDLRELARMAGLDRLVKFEEKGRTVEKHLYELIASHFGRHTYITRMADAGMDDKANKYTTGHSVGQGEFENTYKTKDAVFKAKAIAREYIRKAEVRDTFIFSPVERTEPKPPQPTILIQETSQPTDVWRAKYDEHLKENVLLRMQNNQLTSEVETLKKQDERNKEQLQALPSPFQTVLDEDKYMEMQKELNAYKRGVPYEIYHDESLNAELEAINLECESQYSIDEEKPDQE